MTMNDSLRTHIGETIDGGAWEAVTGVYWEDESTPWQITKFENDVSFEGCLYRCVILEKVVYDPEDITAVDYAEDILAQAWVV